MCFVRSFRPKHTALSSNHNASSILQDWCNYRQYLIQKPLWTDYIVSNSDMRHLDMCKDLPQKMRRCV
jgi:hypothetical protein